MNLLLRHDTADESAFEAEFLYFSISSAIEKILI